MQCFHNESGLHAVHNVRVSGKADLQIADRTLGTIARWQRYRSHRHITLGDYSAIAGRFVGLSRLHLAFMSHCCKVGGSQHLRT